MSREFERMVELVAAKLDAGPLHCEACGCSDLGACAGGCEWDLDYLERGVVICSNCVLGRVAVAMGIPPVPFVTLFAGRGVVPFALEELGAPS